MKSEITIKRFIIGCLCLGFLTPVLVFSLLTVNTMPDDGKNASENVYGLLYADGSHYPGAGNYDPRHGEPGIGSPYYGDLEYLSPEPPRSVFNDN